MIAEQTVKTVSDTSLAAAAITSPIWLQWLQTGAVIYTIIGGMLLLTLRLAIAWREWRAPK